MDVYVILAVEDQLDTRVDHDSVVTRVVCVMKEKPTKKREKVLLRKWAIDQGEDAEDFWIEVEKTKLV